MGKSTISAEWEICDSELQWENTVALEIPPASASIWAASIPTRRIWAALAIILCASTVAGAWVWNTGQIGLNQIETELNAAVDRELWAVRAGNSDLAAGVASGFGGRLYPSRLRQDDALLEKAAAVTSTAGETVAGVEIVRLREFAAAVRAIVRIGDERYWQTQFYRRTPEGWLQMPPESTLLGQWRVLQTEHLSIGHFDLDTKMVAEAGARLDALVTQMRTDFGLSSMDVGARHVLEISYDEDSLERNLITDTQLPGRTTHMDSPLPRWMPATVSESDTVVQIAALHLVYPLIEDTLDRHSERWRDHAWRWLPLLSALRLWELWESDTPLTEWKDDIVTWVYTYPDVAPTRYEEICRAYRLWRLSPLSMSIPLTCESGMSAGDGISRMPDRLHGLIAPEMNCCRWETTTPIFELRVVGLATVLDYAVATFGRERLPQLVEALGEHDSWDRLIPAVFDVSLEEFEQGWQAYMTEKYGTMAGPE